MARTRTVGVTTNEMNDAMNNDPLAFSLLFHDRESWLVMLYEFHDCARFGSMTEI